MTEPAVPPAPGKDAPLQANTVEEFLALLRLLVVRSGRTRGQIVHASGLPRSTVYHFTSEKNSSLPKRQDQVREFARACKLDQHEIEQVLRIWKQLATDEPKPKEEGAPGELTLTVGDSSPVRLTGVNIVNHARPSLFSLALRQPMLTLFAIFSVIAAVSGVSVATWQLATPAADKTTVQPPTDAATSAGWTGLPAGGAWYSLTDYQPSNTAGSVTLGSAQAAGLRYPVTLLLGPGAQVAYTLGGACVAFSTMLGASQRTGDSEANVAIEVYGGNMLLISTHYVAVTPDASLNVALRGVDTLTLRATNDPGTAASLIAAKVYCLSPPGEKIEPSGDKPTK